MVKKMAQVLVSDSTVTRRIEEIAEDIETQLLEMIDRIHYRGTCSRLTSLQILTTRQYYLFICDIFIRGMCIRICCVHYRCQPKPQPQNYSSHWMITYQVYIHALYICFCGVSYFEAMFRPHYNDQRV